MNNTLSIWTLLLPLSIFGMFFLRRWISDLNAKLFTVVPEGAGEIYDNDRYQTSQSYAYTNYKFSKWASLFGLVVNSVLIWFGVYAIDCWVKEKVSIDALVAIVFFGILTIGKSLIEWGFGLWSTFVIERQYGFNKTSVFTAIKDLFASTCVELVINSLLVWIVYLAYVFTGDLFWIAATLGLVGFSVFMSMFYTTLIVPLFNKLSPIPDGELKTAIQEYATKVGFDLKNIFIVDGSKRSTKANAYFSGLGKKKDIVLYDTLVDNYTTNQVVAVLAHEVGHYKYKHIMWGVVLEALYYGVVFYLLASVLNSNLPSLALGVRDGVNFHINLYAFLIVLAPITFLFGVVNNFCSRWMEYQADNYAKKTWNKDDMISALKKLSGDSLSNLNPHWLYVLSYYSHPPVLKRLAALNK